MPKFRQNLPAELPPAESLDVPALLESYKKGDTDLICVLGPTASGKTRFAVRLCHALGRCEIISADSRQVYRGMDIGTGKDLAEYGDTPYHLIDIAPAGDHYNVYRFQTDFTRVYADIRARGAIPVLCGGTGLYIQAVTAGYDFENTRPLSQGNAPAVRAQGLPQRPFFIGTLVSREERNRRIDARLHARLEEGMVDEIARLLAEGLPAERLISYGLEYRYVTLYLQGALSFEEMEQRLRIAIHQFAKRQMTWFRGMERSGTVIHWIDPDREP